MWVAGLGLVWFLSYKMELASPALVHVAAYVPRPRLRSGQGAAERRRRRSAIIVIAVSVSVVVVTALAFGHR
jgi:solute:Na+ symporter, SSS family